MAVKPSDVKLYQNQEIICFIFYWVQSNHSQAEELKNRLNKWCSFSTSDALFSFCCWGFFDSFIWSYPGVLAETSDGWRPGTQKHLWRVKMRFGFQELLKSPIPSWFGKSKLPVWASHFQSVIRRSTKLEAESVLKPKTRTIRPGCNECSLFCVSVVTLACAIQADLSGRTGATRAHLLPVNRNGMAAFLERTVRPQAHREAQSVAGWQQNTEAGGSAFDPGWPFDWLQVPRSSC